MRRSTLLAAAVAVAVASPGASARDRDDPSIAADVAALPADTQVYGPGRPRPPGAGDPIAPGPRTLRGTAVSDDDEDWDDWDDAVRDGARRYPRLQVDVALLAGYDSNPDEIDETEPTATAAIEFAARGAIGNERARLGVAVEGAVVETPQVPASQRYFADVETDGRVRIAEGLAATATANASRYALTQPTERAAAASAGLALDRGGVEASLRAGYEDRRYRDTDSSDDSDDDEDDGTVAAGEQPVRNVSDNALLRVLDYQRLGIDAAVETDGDGAVDPFLSASFHRIRFPNLSEEIADRDAIDMVLSGGLRLGVADGVTLSAGARYNRRRFRDRARGHVANLSPTFGLEIERDWIDLNAGYRRELVQPELTGSIVRDARVLELEARLRPHRDWRLIVDATRETGREILAGARDTEFEITGRVEHAISPALRVLLEGYYDRYRYREAGEEDFASDRTTIRTGLLGRF